MAREFDDETLAMVAERFKVLSEPMRLRLLNCLRPGERTVSDLVEETGASQANVSKHLGLLLRERMVRRRKEGVFAYYAIADPFLFQLCELMCRSLESELASRREALADVGGPAGRPPLPPPTAP